MLLGTMRFGCTAKVLAECKLKVQNLRVGWQALRPSLCPVSLSWALRLTTLSAAATLQKVMPALA